MKLVVLLQVEGSGRPRESRSTNMIASQKDFLSELVLVEILSIDLEAAYGGPTVDVA